MPDRKPPPKLNMWTRVAAVLLGLIGVGSGGVAVFITKSGAGEVALIVSGLVALIIGVGGRLPTQLKAGDYGVGFDEGPTLKEAVVAEGETARGALLQPEVLPALTTPEATYPQAPVIVRPGSPIEHRGSGAPPPAPASSIPPSAPRPSRPVEDSGAVFFSSAAAAELENLTRQQRAALERGLTLLVRDGQFEHETQGSAGGEDYRMAQLSQGLTMFFRQLTGRELAQQTSVADHGYLIVALRRQ